MLGRPVSVAAVTNSSRYYMSHLPVLSNRLCTVFYDDDFDCGVPDPLWKDLILSKPYATDATAGASLSSSDVAIEDPPKKICDMPERIKTQQIYNTWSTAKSTLQSIPGDNNYESPAISYSAIDNSSSETLAPQVQDTLNHDPTQEHQASLSPPQSPAVIDPTASSSLFPSRSAGTTKSAVQALTPASPVIQKPFIPLGYTDGSPGTLNQQRPPLSGTKDKQPAGTSNATTLAGSVSGTTCAATEHHSQVIETKTKLAKAFIGERADVLVMIRQLTSTKIVYHKTESVNGKAMTRVLITGTRSNVENATKLLLELIHSKN